MSLLSPREILQFESLGDDCEFGVVQRKHRVDPLGLFRWGDIRIDKLIAALDTRLEGFGDPREVQFVWVKSEYFAIAPRLGFSCHTGMRDRSATQDVLSERQTRQWRFLAQLLSKDLAEGRKIFVRKQRSVRADETNALLRALRGFGDNALLLVTLADQAHAAGTVESCGDGSMRGYIDRFGDPHAFDATTSFEGWTALCREALRMRALASACDPV